MEIRAERGGGRWRLAVWGGGTLILLAPLVAMQVSDQVAWTPFDFAVLGGLLLFAALGVELAVRAGSSLGYRIGAALTLGLVVLLTAVNGAVGVIGSEDLAANRLYLAIPAVILAGAALSRLRPAGLARTLAVAAGVQVAAPVVAALAGAPAWAPEALVATAVFTAGWLLAALLFRRDAASRAT